MNDKKKDRDKSNRVIELLNACGFGGGAPS